MKPREAKLSHEELTRLLDYDPATGVFRWKVALSNRVHVGQSAGSPDGKGYILVAINGVKYAAHRLAWFYVYKFWPKNEIDHINLVSGDNQITVNGRTRYLGLFDTPEDAHAEYVKASIQHHQQFGRST